MNNLINNLLKDVFADAHAEPEIYGDNKTGHVEINYLDNIRLIYMHVQPDKIIFIESVKYDQPIKFCIYSISLDYFSTRLQSLYEISIHFKNLTNSFIPMPISLYPELRNRIKRFLIVKDLYI